MRSEIIQLSLPQVLLQLVDLLLPGIFTLHSPDLCRSRRLFQGLPQLIGFLMLHCKYSPMLQHRITLLFLQLLPEQSSFFITFLSAYAHFISFFIFSAFFLLSSLIFFFLYLRFWLFRLAVGILGWKRHKYLRQLYFVHRFLECS